MMLVTYFFVSAFILPVFGVGVRDLRDDKSLDENLVRSPHGDQILRPLIQRDSNTTANSSIVYDATGDAAALVAAGLEALAVRNKLRLENPRFNKYEIASQEVLQGADAPSLLDYIDTSVPLNVTRRQLDNSTASVSVAPGPDGSYKYTIPSELIEAAKVVAESTPQSVSKGNQSEVAAQIRQKYALRVNDTNSMPATVAMTKVPSFGDNSGADGIAASNETTALTAAENELEKRAGTSAYWLATMTQRGSSPYAPSGYKVSIKSPPVF